MIGVKDGDFRYKTMIIDVGFHSDLYIIPLVLLIRDYFLNKKGKLFS